MMFENLNGNDQNVSNQIMKFDSQANKISKKTTSLVYLFLLLSGSIYFAFTGFWTHALVCAVLAAITWTSPGLLDTKMVKIGTMGGCYGKSEVLERVSGRSGQADH